MSRIALCSEDYHIMCSVRRIRLQPQLLVEENKVNDNTVQNLKILWMQNNACWHWLCVWQTLVYLAVVPFHHHDVWEIYRFKWLVTYLCSVV